MNTSHRMNIIKGKMVLIVDDEADIISMLSELLSECRLDMASSFEEAKELLKSKYYDIAILDIMGVGGYDLLEIAKKRDIPALMLTSHALSEKDLNRSFQNGASYYVPKEQMQDIATFVADVLEAREKNKNVFLKWYERLGWFFDKKFGGADWREKEREFWEEKEKSLHWR